MTAQRPTPRRVKFDEAKFFAYLRENASPSLRDLFLSIDSRAWVEMSTYIIRYLRRSEEDVGRACYGIELDPIYVDTTIRRWQKLTGMSATHANDGSTFAELERRALDDKGRHHE